MVYFSFTYQDNLFNEGILDPKEFAKIMKISQNRIFGKHSNPRIFKNDPVLKENLISEEIKNGKFSKSRVWDSELENALYILANETFIKNYESRYFDENNNEVKRITLKTFNFLDDFSIEYIKVGKAKKIIYKYNLSDKFIANLNLFTFNIDIK